MTCMSKDWGSKFLAHFTKWAVTFKPQVWNWSLEQSDIFFIHFNRVFDLFIPSHVFWNWNNQLNLNNKTEKLRWKYSRFQIMPIFEPLCGIIWKLMDHHHGCTAKIGMKSEPRRAFRPKCIQWDKYGNYSTFSQWKIKWVIATKHKKHVYFDIYNLGIEITFNLSLRAPWIRAANWIMIVLNVLNFRKPHGTPEAMSNFLAA